MSSSDLGMPGKYRKFPRSEVDSEPYLLQVDLEAASISMQPTFWSRFWKTIKKVVNVLLWIAILIFLGYELTGVITDLHRSESSHNFTSTVSSTASAPLDPLTSSLDWPTTSIQDTMNQTDQASTIGKQGPTTELPVSTVLYPVTIPETSIELPYSFDDPYEVAPKPWCPDWMPKETCDWYASGSTWAPPTTSTRFPFVQKTWTMVLMPGGKCPPGSETFCDWLRTLKTEAPEMSEQVLGSDD